MASDTYVISVYRRGKRTEKTLTVLAEHTGSRESKAFSNGDELWSFLIETSGHGVVKKARRHAK